MLDEVKKWLTEQGYPLEMRAAKIFRKAGFEVQQAQLYTDDEAGKRREIDLIAMSPDHVGLTQIAFTIECKSSKKPWILFSSGNNLGQNVYWTYCLMNQATRSVMASIGWDDLSESDLAPESPFEKFRWLRKSVDTAFSIRQAFNDKDVAYAAVVSSIKAASHLLRAERSSKLPNFRFIFPVVVIDSPLLLCKLGEMGDPELTQVSSGEILFTNPDRNEDMTCVRITTIDELPNLLNEAKIEIKQIRKEFRSSEVALWEERYETPYPHKLADLAIKQYD
ncbi:hypothetical protein [Tunturiibacter gelidiferens]|uniref:Restriction endonuclease type IV Mrr domain-containing protein n=1 Tax=Tunturiibacter gelidiferens TaxID=3069689 RepID=A0AAU7Z6N2_9BACT